MHRIRNKWSHPFLISDVIYTPGTRYNPPCADRFQFLLPYAINIKQTHIMIQQGIKEPTYEGGLSHEPRVTEELTQKMGI